MSPTTLRRCLAPSAPAVLLILVAFVLHLMGQTQTGAAMAQGALVALPLTLVAGTCTGLTVTASLPIAAGAAMGAFLVRIGGAGAFCLLSQPAGATAAALVSALAAGLVVESITWARMNRQEPLRG